MNWEEAQMVRTNYLESKYISDSIELSKFQGTSSPPFDFVRSKMTLTEHES